MKVNLRWAVVFLLLPLSLLAQNLEQFEKRVTEFTLANGMQFIVVERHQAPVVSFHAYVNAGAVNDPGGKTGLAHMFEHMIGKGTAEVGSKNWPAERRALAAVETAYDRLDAEQRKGRHADKQKIARLKTALQAAMKKANSYVETNKFVRVIEENGAVGFNADTGFDATQFYYSLPSNRVELWFLLQSEWFRQPVYREFYKERDVVMEERRMRVDSNPMGMLREVFLATAFAAHPYRTAVGWASDIQHLRATDAAWFHRIYYVPGNITIGIVGDVDPARMRRLAEKYYGRIPAGEMLPPVITVEPPQQGEKRALVESDTQPFLMIGYKRPNQNDPDDPVFDVLSGILASGRTGILYKTMVRDKKIALAAMTLASFPAGKYPNLFLFYCVPNRGHTIQENEQAFYNIIDHLKKNKVDAETLKRVKTKVRAGVIRSLESNAGLATALTFYQVNYGDWRMLFNSIGVIDKVTAADVQRVVRKYFRPKLRTVAYDVKPGHEEEGK